jgi:hypothetical protein
LSALQFCFCGSRARIVCGRPPFPFCFGFFEATPGDAPLSLGGRPAISRVCRCHREAAVVGAAGGHDGGLHIGRRRLGRLQHRLPRPARGVPRRRQGPPQQRAPPPRVTPGARRAPPRAPPPHRPPPLLLRPAR